MVTIRHERAGDGAAREKLLDRVFGEARFLKTCERLRKDRLPSAGLAFAAYEGRKLVGTVRLWDVVAGSAGPVLLLGPLAIAPDRRGRGIGAALMRHAIAEAGLHGHDAILLVGDEPYYRRFGFSARSVKGLILPGPVDRQRFLGLELAKDALKGARGPVTVPPEGLLPAVAAGIHLQA
jgi:predicted N-acetyltransferase YhbS